MDHFNASNKPPKVFISRIEHFNASHRLHSLSLSDEMNKEIYGKCNNLNGHGHNYTVETVLYGPVNEQTGMVFNIHDLKVCLKDILEELDHKNLDKDVEYFANRVSTTENVAIFIWQRIKETLSKPELLYEVKVHETENNIVMYRGD